MKKTDLIRDLSLKTKLDKPFVRKAIDTILSSISTSLHNGKPIDVRGFGTFKLKDYDGYIGRNPKTGESVEVGPKRVPIFKAHGELNKVINGGNSSS